MRKKGDILNNDNDDVERPIGFDTAELGKKIEILRRAKGLTQDELSHTSGLSLRQYARISKGKSSPPLETLNKIAGALGVELSELMPKDEEIIHQDVSPEEDKIINDKIFSKLLEIEKKMTSIEDKNQLTSEFMDSFYGGVADVLTQKPKAGNRERDKLITEITLLLPELEINHLRLILGRAQKAVHPRLVKKPVDT